MKYFLIPLLTLIIGACSQPEAKIEQKQVANQTPKSKKELMALVQNDLLAPIGTIYRNDSTALTTQAFKGKLVVLDFWATWCGPCLKEAPAFHELAEKYKDKKVAFASIATDEEFAYWKKFTKEREMDFAHNYWLGAPEKDPFFAFTYQEMEFEGQKNIVMALPTYIFIGPDGIILDNAAPRPTQPSFEEAIEQYLKKYNL